MITRSCGTTGLKEEKKEKKERGKKEEEDEEKQRMKEKSLDREDTISSQNVPGFY